MKIRSFLGNAKSSRGVLGKMRRLLVCLLFAFLLVCSLVGLKNVVAQTTGSDTPVVLASGGAPPPPIPDLGH